DHDDPADLHAPAHVTLEAYEEVASLVNGGPIRGGQWVVRVKREGKETNQTRSKGGKL
ncbi:MAG: hypothetical protein HY347_11485, partial [candidate division NC10 bacterium]|nr:hypothetical protein [candidate division NC10 bacterium]